MAKKATAQQRAENYRSQARKALITLGLTPAIDKRAFVDDDGVENWEAFSTTPIVLPNRPLPGRWYLQMRWLVSGDPAGKEAQVVESTISLNVTDSSLTEGLSTQCLVRYDIDHRLTAPTAGFSPAHLNVLQPGRLEDRLHYPAVGLDIPTWDIRAVLSFLLSQRFWDELLNRLGGG
jgi:hypothetical protein